MSSRALARGPSMCSACWTVSSSANNAPRYGVFASANFEPLGRVFFRHSLITSSRVAVSFGDLALPIARLLRRARGEIERAAASALEEQSTIRANSRTVTTDDRPRLLAISAGRTRWHLAVKNISSTRTRARARLSRRSALGEARGEWKHYSRESVL
jgi:hypothetical protein